MGITVGALARFEHGGKDRLGMVLFTGESCCLCRIGDKDEFEDGIAFDAGGTHYLARPERTFWVNRSDLVSIGKAPSTTVEKILRDFSGFAVKAYHAYAHETKDTFCPGQSPIHVAGRVFDDKEMLALNNALLDFWLTSGPYEDLFNQRLAKFISVRHALCVNSGSSANLLALSALTSVKLKDHALKPGDEVITVAGGFPTTITPILQNNCIPVFVDMELDTYNIDPEKLDQAIGAKTKAIMLAHTLGHPFNLDVVMDLAQKHGLWVIEDCCDALGAQWQGKNGTLKKCGSFGHIGTFSFYPAHHITMGEGGAVVTNDTTLSRIMASFRDWGRDCWCKTGQDNCCGKRYAWNFNGLEGYDHKYIYSHAGYNLKLTDMQAAIGLAQMDKLDGFIAARTRNYQTLCDLLRPVEHHIILPSPHAKAKPSWFGMPLMFRDPKKTGMDRARLLTFLNQRHIATRLLFAGNTIRQPFMNGKKFRVVGQLDNTDAIMQRLFWLGIYPALGHRHLSYMADSLLEYFQK